MKSKVKEEWKPVVGFEKHYQISNLGRVKSQYPKRKMKILKSRIDRAGYYTIRLDKEGKSFTRYLHRILTEAFLSNPLEKPIVNHINGDKLDNSLGNLEWVTYSENQKHAYDLGLCPRHKPNPRYKKVIDICSNKTYKSIREASKASAISYRTCRRILNEISPNKTCLRLVA